MDKQGKEKQQDWYRYEITINSFVFWLNDVSKMFCDIKLVFILISLLFVSHVDSNEGQFSIEKRLQYK
jgi:hypothetical protein